MTRYFVIIAIKNSRMRRVPNAKPERESTEIEIYGMQGIPADVLAAHYGDLEEDTPSKAAKFDLPAPNIVGGIMPTEVGFPPRATYGVMPRPMYNPAVAAPFGWQLPRQPAWYPPYPSFSVPPAVSVPPVVSVPPQQPLFPVQSAATPSSSPAAPVPQPPLQANPGVQSSPAHVPVP